MPANEDFMADILWLHATYYFGLHYQTDKKYLLLDDYLDGITEFSPRWERPYLFAAVNIPLQVGKVDLGLQYISKGLRYHPRDWKLWFFKGIYLFQVKKDYDQASKSLSRASSLPGAPGYLSELSLTLASKAERNLLSRKFLQNVLEGVQDRERRKKILEKFKELSSNESDSGKME